MGIFQGIAGAVAIKLARAHARSVAKDLLWSGARFKEANRSLSPTEASCVRQALTARTGWQQTGPTEFLHAKSFTKYEFPDELGAIEIAGRVAICESVQVWIEAGHGQGMRLLLTKEALAELGKYFASLVK